MAPAHLSPGQFAGSLSVDCGPTLTLGAMVTCEERYTGNFFGLNAKSLLDVAHFLSSGLVGFARGLNDTPKIAAILIASSAISHTLSIGLVSVFIAAGGFYSQRELLKECHLISLE